jgi:hypothetical protein
MRRFVLSLAFTLLAPLPVSAMTMAECGQRYQEAQKAGTLAGKGWNAFRRDVCLTEAAASTGQAATTAAPAGKAPVFPAAVDRKYASEPARTARMHSCLDQYRANKPKGDNGGLNWIQKGGGYYSQCSKHLKKG